MDIIGIIVLSVILLQILAFVGIFVTAKVLEHKADKFNEIEEKKR